ncbi:HDOD domain-containing protein [Marinobacterium marinum]|uniref:HDOD domain-containing protein n=1 Tax=Marinobacterium marinum TaxID=2756129 RepID=A0A7W2ACW4_9GAMM|nr:HDOD domain-containing protein [Marinobacterium marinum]MBA4503520.1 HDOD domain-containing protein [Marinobacterium marinum]
MQPDRADAPRLHGLQAWADYLEHRPLPVRTGTLARFRQLLGNERSTLQQIAHLVSGDPVLSLHITRHAQQVHRHKGASVTSIQHAVGLLGLERLEQLTRQLSGLKIRSDSMQHKMFLRALADSLHASFQSAELCRQRGLPFVEEVRLAALLYGFTHWMAWLHAPLHKQYYQQRVLLQGVDVALAEQDLFGCTLQALGAELARRWALPELTRDALNHATSPDRNTLNLLHRRAMQDPALAPQEQRQINQLTQQRFFPVKLGNWLALTTTRSWYSDKSLRLLDILADYLRQPADRLATRLHQHCAEAARRYPVAGALSPAAELLMLPTPTETPRTGLIPNAELARLEREDYPALTHHTPRPVQAAPHPVPPTDTRPPPSEHRNERLFQQTLARLSTPQTGLQQASQVIQTLLQGLHLGLGLSRLGVLLVNTNRLQLQCAHTIGLAEGHPLKDIRLSLNVPSLFKRLSEKPAGVWMDTENRDRLGVMLPESFTSRLDGNDYLLMSVFQQDRPLIILYADDLPQHPRLSQFQFDHFRQLCATATRALRR